MTFIEDVKLPLTFMVIVLLGRLLQLKVQSVQHIMGFQQIIMSCFLPALLLQSITSLPLSELSTSWQYTLIALAYSFFLLVCMYAILLITKFTSTGEEMNTLLIMFPGLAPGLTSLPYVTLCVAQIKPHNVNGGQVGLADLGIKFFVLFLSFVFALKLSHKTDTSNRARARRLGRRVATVEQNLFQAKGIRNLIYSFFTEPVNFASLLGVVLLAVGPYTLEDQSIWGHAIKNLATCCAPAIFLLIGMKVKTMQKQRGLLLFLMMFRTGLGFLFTYILSKTLYTEPNEIMFWIFVCNSSLSFWPYTHICKIGVLEEKAIESHCESLLQQAADDDVLPKPMKSFLFSLKNRLQEGDASAARVAEEACLFVTSTLQEASFCATSSSSLTVISPRVSPRGSNFSSESSVDTSIVEARVTALMNELEGCQNRKFTFDPTLALIALSVSTTWTVFSNTVLALTPVGFWVSAYTVPTIGCVLVFIGVAGLVWRGWLLHRTEKKTMEAEARQTAKQTPPELQSDSLRHEPVRRSSVYSGDIDMMEACEGAFVVRDEEAKIIPSLLARVRRSSCSEATLGSQERRHSAADYALRTSMVRVPLDQQEDSVFARVHSSQPLDCHGGTPNRTRLSSISKSERLHSISSSSPVAPDIRPTVMSSAYSCHEKVDKPSAAGGCAVQKIGKFTCKQVDKPSAVSDCPDQKIGETYM